MLTPPAPWDALARATFDTCEPDVAGWIVHPAETASALAYLVVAVALWRTQGRDRPPVPARVLPAVVAGIGGASLLFHGSFRAVFQTLDLAVIALFTGYLLAAALVHRRRLAPARRRRTALALSAVGVAAPTIELGLGFAMVAAQAMAVLWLWRGAWLGDARRDARRAMWLLLPGAGLLALDHGGIGCLRGSLEHLVQPHVAWHLLSAASLYYCCRAERRLERRW